MIMPSFLKKFKNFFSKKASDDTDDSICLKNFNIMSSNSVRNKLNILENIRIDETNIENHSIALYDYKKQSADDIDINKNDILILIYKAYPDFYLVKNLRTKQIGFVQNNNVEMINNIDNKE